MLGGKYMVGSRGRSKEKGLGSRVRQREITCDSETEIMADRFNEVLLDVMLNCNYSALLSAGFIRMCLQLLTSLLNQCEAVCVFWRKNFP